jgi:hypothetical protein
VGCAHRDEVERVRLSPRTVVGRRADVQGDEQVVRISPEELAASAACGLNTYALARCIESEWGSGPAPALIAIGEVAINHAKQLGIDVFTMLVREPKKPDQHGYFGRQSGRWAATSLSPTRRSIEAAEVALSGTGLAGGAEKFFDPEVSNRGKQAGKDIPSALVVYDEWTKEGWRYVSRAPAYTDWCVDPHKLFLLGKRDRAIGVASLERGRWLLEQIA